MDTFTLESIGLLPADQTADGCGYEKAAQKSQVRRSSERVPVSDNTWNYSRCMSRIMVSLPDDLLKCLDEEARRRSISRSALLAVAACRELSRRDPETVAEAITRSERRFRESGEFESSDLVRALRDGA